MVVSLTGMSKAQTLAVSLAGGFLGRNISSILHPPPFTVRIFYVCYLNEQFLLAHRTFFFEGILKCRHLHCLIQQIAILSSLEPPALYTVIQVEMINMARNSKQKLTVFFMSS